MLEHLGETEAALRVEQAAVGTLGKLAKVESGTAGEARPGEGGYTTQQVGDMVVEALGS